MSKDYLTNHDPPVVWPTNFETKISTTGPGLGLAAGDIIDLTNIC